MLDAVITLALIVPTVTALVTLPTDPVTLAIVTSAATLASVIALSAIPAAVSQLFGIAGKFVKLVTVVIVPAVMFVVFAIVPVGNVAAKNPVGCEYVAILDDTATSRFPTVNPVTAETVGMTAPVCVSLDNKARPDVDDPVVITVLLIDVQLALYAATRK
jgi:hypothetical protein